jgi:hypothetical protein
MTMHLLPSFINSNGNTRRKPSARQQRAKAEHEAWLRKMGLDADTLSKKTAQSHKGKLQGNFVKDRNGLPCSNSFAPSGGKKSIFDATQRPQYEDDAMAQREAIAMRQAELKKSRVIPLWNKAGLQLASEHEDLTKVGSLSRRP